ncbi:Pyruvate dehydrogenase E1 component subunit alpha [Hibiscus syriacus]|uniref:Pyruvate dehydrogenase E1 component subunit alpha n=1 Tax=Hibiscus syriacus TaxID=106335 RepID=A0A6A2ZAW2_HIBSY|nr:Pyruvate dehydrogenase E1 component subunit alpha [Hibiscus syriacus]
MGRGNTLLEVSVSKLKGPVEWKAAKSPAYYKRVDFVHGLKVDGMYALAVKQACKFAKEHALKSGPIILEMDTHLHERDPIERIRKLILSHNLASEKELKDIEKEVIKEVDDAITRTKESPM